MLPNGPSSFFPNMFPTALNGPIGPSKASIDAHGWAPYFSPDNLSDCFEWARQSMQSQHRRSWMGPAVSPRECFQLLRMGQSEHIKPVLTLINGPSKVCFRLL